MNTEFKVRNIKTIGDISIAAETLVKIIGGDLTVKLKVPLDMIYDGMTKRIDFAEVFDKSLIGQSPVRGDMRLPPSPDCSDAMQSQEHQDYRRHLDRCRNSRNSPDCSDAMVSTLMAAAMRPAPIGDDQDHIGE